MKRTEMTKSALFKLLDGFRDDRTMGMVGIESILIKGVNGYWWRVYEEQCIGDFKKSPSLSRMGDSDIVVVNDFTVKTMTVGQLIGQLQRFDANVPVVIYNDETGGYIESVYEVTKKNAPYFRGDDWWSGHGSGEEYNQIPKMMVCISSDDHTDEDDEEDEEDEEDE